MSFPEQERALFDLLFDQALRERFCTDGLIALSAYELAPAEREDFAAIRPDALALDADMRRYLILTQMCRALPLSFALVSSLSGGILLLKALIDTQTMRMPPIERTATFGARLREQLAASSAATDNDKRLILAIVEVELGMAWTACSLKDERLQGKASAVDELPAMPQDWCSRAIKLAAYVSAALLPQPYARLRQALCPCAEAELWKHLSRHPLTSARRSEILQNEDPRLLVSRAYISRHSDCEPNVEHKTAELSQGFAHLFQHINGSNTVDGILGQLQAAGAEDGMLQSVRAGFRQLLETGMLTFAAPTDT